MKGFIIIIFCCLLVVCSNAQSIHVLYMNGPCTKISNGISKNLKYKDLIKNGEVTVLPKNTELILSLGEDMICLKKEGSYNYKTLTEFFKKGEKNILNRYFSFVISEILQEEQEVNYSQTVGVSRGLSLRFLQPPDSSVIIEDTIMISWETPVMGAVCTFRLIGPEGNQLEIFSASVSEYPLLYKSLSRETESTYTIEVSSKGDTITSHFTIPTQQKKDQYLKEIQQYRASIDKGKDGYQKTWNLALFLIDRHFYNLAYKELKNIPGFPEKK